MARHHALLEGAIGAHGGHVFHVVGDGFCSVFDDARRCARGGARCAARAAPRKLGRGRPGTRADGLAYGNGGGARRRLRRLAHARARAARGRGRARRTDAALRRPPRAAFATALPKGTTLRDLGVHKLRGLAETENIFELVAADLPSAFPPLRVEDVAASSAAPLQQLVRGRLVGRADEAQLLRQHWDNAQQARGHLVLAVRRARRGEDATGAGPDRARAEERRDHPARRLLRVRGDDAVHAVRRGLPRVDAPAERRSSCARRSAPRRPRSPSSRRRSRPSSTRSSPTRRCRRARSACASSTTPRGFCARWRRRRGLLLFIDDVHWADQGTLSLLHYLLRHLRDDRVLVLAAYREIELDRAHPLASALVEWNRERLATRVALGRLSRADTSALLSTLFGIESVSDDFVVRAVPRDRRQSVLHRGGHQVADRAGPDLPRGGSLGAQGDCTSSRSRRASRKRSAGGSTRLGEPTVDALRIAAALGKIFPFRELRGRVHRDRGCAARCARRSERGAAHSREHRRLGRHAFRRRRQLRLHPRQDPRSALRGAESDPPPPAASAHRRNARKAVRRGATTARGAARADEHAQDLAHHFMHAGELAKSLDYSRRAARDAERVFAHDEALEFLEQAREAAEALQRAGRAASRSTKQMGDIHEARGTTQPAVASYERALADGDGSRGARGAQRQDRNHVLQRRRSARAALPRGGARDARSRDADERARRRDGVDGPLLPLSHRAPQSDRVSPARAGARRAARRRRRRSRSSIRFWPARTSIC